MEPNNIAFTPNEARKLLSLLTFLEGLKKRPSYCAINEPYTSNIDNNLKQCWGRIRTHTQPFMEKTVLSVPGVHLENNFLDGH